MRQWPNDPTVAHLVFVDHHHVPSVTTIEDAVEHARRRGARSIRTSALFPRAAEIVLGLDFVAIDRLALLRRELVEIDDLPTATSMSTRPMLPWQHRAIAHVDQAAFGPLWGNDAVGIREIRTATPEHRARIVRRGRAVAGFAISGAAGDNGYLQRLAVLPTARRGGLASSLVVDALGWMYDRGLRSVLVNTGCSNTAALGLYRGLGFEVLDEELVIAERQIG